MPARRLPARRLPARCLPAHCLPRTLLVLALAASFSHGLVTDAHALWGRDGVRIIPNRAGPSAVAADGQGGGYVFWESWPDDVRAIRFLSDGSIATAWPAAGLIIGPGTAGSFCSWNEPQWAMPDGLGGALVFVRKSCFGASFTYSVCRVDPNGTSHEGWPSAFEFPGRDGYFSGIGDGFGGALGVWHERVTGTTEPIWFQRLGPSGQPAWPKYLLGSGNLSRPPTVAPDGEGGGIVAWPCRVMRLDSLAVIQWDFILPSCGPVVASPVCATDGDGGAFILWNRGTNVYVLRVTSDGSVAPGWNPTGFVVANVATNVLAITRDGDGGVFVSWAEPSSGTVNRVQRITGAGAVAAGWPSSGTVVHGNPVPDGTGGAYFAWGGADAYALHLLADGSVDPGWLSTGSPIGLPPEDDGDVRSVTDGAGGFCAVWLNASGTPAGSIYAQHVAAGENIPLGVAPVGSVSALTIAAPRPNPVRGELTCAISLPTDGTARVEVFDLSGRLVARRDLRDATPGVHTVRLDTGPSPGVYLVRLTQRDQQASTRVVTVH